MTPMLGIMSSSRAAFTPSSLSNMAGWYDPSVSSSVTLSSGKVSQLNDLSGNARHMVQATSAQQPTYTTSGRNGLNIMTFNGVENMAPSGTFSSTYLTMFIVVKNEYNDRTATNWTNEQLDLQNGDTGSNIYDFQLGTGGTNYYHWADGATNGAWHYFSITRPLTGTNPTATIDGGGSWSNTRVAGNTIPALSTGRLGIGKQYGGAQPMYGQMGEIILYSDIKNSTDIGKVNTYLAAKWGF